MKNWILAGAVLVTGLKLGACENRAGQGSGRTSKPSMFGGQAASAEKFPSAVGFFEITDTNTHLFACSGTKIGPRHFITAGHCVVNHTGREGKPINEFPLKRWARPGANISIRNSSSRVDESQPDSNVTVVATHVFPALKAVVDSCVDSCSEFLSFLTDDSIMDTPADVAIVEVQEETKNISASIVSLVENSTLPTDLFVVGFGANTSFIPDYNTLAKTTLFGEKRWSRYRAESWASLKDADDLPLSRQDREITDRRASATELARNFLFRLDSTAGYAGLGWGDSGSGVFAKEDGSELIGVFSAAFHADQSISEGKGYVLFSYLGSAVALTQEDPDGLHAWISAVVGGKGETVPSP